MDFNRIVLAAFTLLLFIVIPFAAYAQDTILRGEYYINVDPGGGNAQPFDVTSDGSAEFDVDVSHLPIGFHTIYFRMQNDNGTWGAVEQQRLFIPVNPSKASDDQIVEGEYFFDEDPGEGNGVPVTVDENQPVSIDVLNISVDELSVGPHKFGVRFRNRVGAWGAVKSSWFFVPPIPSQKDEYQIVAAEYFFKDDPGEGMGIPVSMNNLSDFSPSSYDLYSLGIGIHALSVRLRSKDGVWGPAERRSLIITEEVFSEIVDTPPTNTPRVTPTPTATVTPTPTVTPVAIPTSTPTPTDVPTNTPIPTSTGTATPTVTLQPTSTFTSTPTPTVTPVSVIPTSTHTPTVTPVNTPIPTPTGEPEPFPRPEMITEFEFDKPTLSANGWGEIPGGFLGAPAGFVSSIRLVENQIPSSEDNQGLFISVLPGEVAFIRTNEPIHTNGDPILLRMNVRATGAGASLALAALKGRLATFENVDGSIATHVPASTHNFMEQAKRMVLIYEPDDGTIMTPIIQLVSTSETESVTVFVDKLEVYRLDRSFYGSVIE